MPKPVRKHRRFIDKKRDNVTTFKLVHRSQRDPLATDADAPQHILQPIASEKNEARREQQREFGIYFDDNYDYLQHLRDKDEGGIEWEEVETFKINKEDAKVKPKLKLPSSVFATDYEEDIGILNRAAPRSGPLVGLKPDVLEVLETLDDDYEVEEVIKGEDLAKIYGHEADNDNQNDVNDEEDDQAETELDQMLAQMDDERSDDEEGNEEFSSDFGGSCSENDEVPDMDGRFMFGKEETKSRFTEYSMSSSVVKRSEQLVTLDDRFEEFFEKYEDENTGGLEFDDIEGFRPETSDLMSKMVEEFEVEKEQERQMPDDKSKALVEVDEDDDKEEEETEILEVHEPREKWDCESILSTYSNIYHHPKLISEPSKKVQPIVISNKTGIPKDVLGKGLTLGALKQLDRENAEISGRDFETATLTSRVSELSIRNKHETLDEKRARKNAFKEYKRERRLEKKATKNAFKDEQMKQEKNQINNRNNLQGQKIM